MRRAAAVLALGVMLGATAGAQSVSMSGRLGDKALLVIDGTPRTVAAGSTVQGVKLLKVDADAALVEVNGQKLSVPLGGTPVSVGGGGGTGSGGRIVLTASSGGHFFSSGQINGRAVRFLVDTGATVVALSESEAQRLGVDYKRGQRGLANTANGTVTAWRVMLDAVRVGDVTVYGVEALVVPAGMDHVLLGNSFLTRFSMRRDADVLTLERRY